jgi:HlyD family secretion protein
MAAKRASRWLGWGVLLVLLAGGVYGWQRYGRRAKEAPADYRTNVVARGDIVQLVTATGQINPVTNVQVGSQVSGIIKTINVDYNSRVTNGQVIALIDPSTYQQNLTQAEADLASAEAARARADLEHRRAETLWRSKLLADSDYEKTKVDLLQAEAMKKMREAAVERARVDLSRTVITAPVNGIVISRNIDVGQTVAASFSTPTLFLIANDLTQMQIEAMVSEADVGGVEVGQRVEFNVDAFFGRKFEGRVKQVRYAPITNQNVVNYISVVDVNNPDLKLRPGMTATASIITAQTNDVLRVPNTAFLFRPRDTGLKGQTNTATRLAALATNRATLTNAASTNGPTSAVSSTPTPTPPWVAEGRPPNGFDEVRKWMDSLPPDQREAARRQMRERRGAGGGGGEGGFAGRGGSFGGGEGGFGGGREGLGREGGRGGPGGAFARAASIDGPAIRTVYVLDKEGGEAGEPPRPRAVTIKTGISDGTYTEVTEGLKEGEVVITGLNLPTPATATAARPGGNPFGPPFGGLRPR